MRNIENKLYNLIDFITGGIDRFFRTPEKYLLLDVPGYSICRVDKVFHNELSITQLHNKTAQMQAEQILLVEIDFQKLIARVKSLQNQLFFRTSQSEDSSTNPVLQKELNEILYEQLNTLKKEGFSK